MRGLAIASFVLGIIGFLFCWIGIGIIPAILALIFGFIACFSRTERVMAIAGLVLGIIGTIISASMIYITYHPEMILEEMKKMTPEIEEKAKRLKKQTESVMKKTEPEEKTIDYVSLNLSVLERIDQIKLKPKVASFLDKTINTEPDAHVFGIMHTTHTLQPKKGEDALILLVEVKNPGNKYIFPCIMPGYGYMIDTKGNEYRAIGDAIEGKPKGEKDWYAEVFLENIGWVSIIPSRSATENVIAPEESFRWIYIFHIPKERKPKEFLFKYDVGETADLSVGEKWKGKSYLSLVQ